MIFLQKVFASSVALCFACSMALAQVPVTAPLSDKARDAEALYVDAVKARMLDDNKTEESLLKEVISRQPGQAAPYYDLARLYQKQRKYDLAEANIKKAIDRSEENIWYQSTYAEVLEEQNKTEEAANVYRLLSEKERYNKEYLFHAARLYEGSGKYQEAIDMIDKLLAKTDNDEQILGLKQQLYLRMNDLSGAVKVAEQMIAANPGEGHYYANLAELYSNNGQPEKAREIFEKAMKKFPDDPSLQYGLALYYKEQKDVAKYQEYVRKAVLNPAFDDETQTKILMAYLQDLSDDTTHNEERLKLTGDLVALHPHSAQIVNLYAEVLLSQGQDQQAQEAFKKTVALDPSRFVAWQRLLFAYTAKQDADSLIRYAGKALRYFPNQATIHFLQGIGYFNKEDYKPAAQSILRAIDLQPEDNKSLLGDMYSTLGDVYHAQDRHSASDSAYEQALKLNPANASLLNNYAYYLSVRGVRLNEAEKMSKRSLELRPEEATFLDTYGWILYKKGEYEKAKQYIQQAVDKSEDPDGTLLEHLGDLYYKLGDKEKALELWKKAKRKGTENKLIDKKIQDKKLYE